MSTLDSIEKIISRLLHPSMRAERKRAEDALLAGEKRLALAARAAGIGIWDWDPAADTLEWDPTLLHLHGLAPDQAPRRGADWLGLVHPDDRSRVAAELRDCRQGADLHSQFRI